jgi:hypothetical protein
VRELENAVERAMVVAQEPELREQDFIFKAQAPPTTGRSLDDIERAHILRTLDECNGNQSRAAEVLASTASRSITSSSAMAGRGHRWSRDERDGARSVSMNPVQNECAPAAGRKTGALAA